MSKIKYGAIIFAEIPYTEYNPHQHHGKHYYIVLAKDHQITSAFQTFGIAKSAD